MIHWLRIYFDFPNGWVWPNVAAMLPCGLIAWGIAWRKKMCAWPWCWRLAAHEVKGTTWKVCARHHRPHFHLMLFGRHKRKHPERLGWGESHEDLMKETR